METVLVDANQTVAQKRRPAAINRRLKLGVHHGVARRLVGGRLSGHRRRQIQWNALDFKRIKAEGLERRQDDAIR